MDLSAIYTSFNAYCESLFAYNETTQSQDGIAAEFTNLKERGISICNSPDHPRTVGNMPENKPKNRFRDIIPFDDTRVKLSTEAGSDYINANYIKGIHGNAAYIATQAPLPKTIADFWRMIWEAKSKVVIMACNDIEGNKVKCERYWPLSEAEPVEYDGFKISLQSTDTRDGGDFLIRRLYVEHSGTTRTVMQYQYRAWPDHGIPPSVASIIDLIAACRKYQPADNPPLVVHCSAGCGRTGTVIIVDYVWNLLNEGLLNKHLNVLEILTEMRKQRQALVQTVDQYEIALKCIQELLKQKVTAANENCYYNVVTKKHFAVDEKLKDSSCLAEVIMDSPYDINATTGKKSLPLDQPSSSDQRDSPTSPTENSYEPVSFLATSTNTLTRSKPAIPARPNALSKIRSEEDKITYSNVQYAQSIVNTKDTEKCIYATPTPMSAKSETLKSNESEFQYSYVDTSNMLRKKPAELKEAQGSDITNNENPYSLASEGLQPPPIPLKTSGAYSDYYEVPENEIDSDADGGSHAHLTSISSTPSLQSMFKDKLRLNLHKLIGPKAPQKAVLPLDILNAKVMYKGVDISYPNWTKPLTGSKSMPLSFK